MFFFSKRNHSTIYQLLLKIPHALLLEIVYFLEYSDQMEFAFVNKTISNQLTRDVRQIEISKREFFYSENYGVRLLSLINRPLYQLKIRESGDIIPLSANTIKNTRNLSLAQLTTNKVNIIHFLVVVLGCTIQEIRLRCIHEEEDRLAKLTEICGIESSVKSFIVSNWNKEIFPTFLRLESLELFFCSSITIAGLNLSSYSNLRRLKLAHCSSIVDVSCLNHIHDLSLESCSNIVDISCLNHNNKINIELCNKIEDYSRSFSFSQKIRVRITRSECTPVNPVILQDIYELEVTGNHWQVEQNVLRLPPTRYLRSLVLLQFQQPFSLPENYLTELTIIQSSLQSCINMGGIRLVKLDSLSIRSLDGLGSRNQSVEINTLPNISNFSCLRKCKKVIIRNCDRFTDVSQLKGVAEVHLLTSNSNMDLQGVTCLTITDNTFKSMMSMIKTTKSIQQIKIERLKPLELKICLYALCQIQHIQKIMIYRLCDLEGLLRNDSDLRKNIREKFIDETPVRSISDILLKRSRK